MSQVMTLLHHLATESHITQLQAIGVHRIYNLKGRINDLRKAGWSITTTFHVDRAGKRYARYSLDAQHKEAALFVTTELQAA
jgi:hypothetical protein